MLSFNRRIFCLLSASFLTSCGFEPVYGPSGSAEGLRGAVIADDPTDKNGFDFVKNLEERIGTPENPSFALSYDIRTTIEALAITQAQETTRYNVIGKITFVLRNMHTQEIVTSGEAENFTSFGATSNTVSTRAAREDAAERLMMILSNDISEHLILNAPSFLP